jgi:hypothetical protein
MTDRDCFAAAALTGLLAAPTDKDRAMEYWARLSYEAADAMLRERGDTEPMPKEKRASVSQQEPVAWAVVYPNGELGVVAFCESDAEDRATASDSVVPLYRQPQPTLTDAEREAICQAVTAYDGNDDDKECAQIAATLRKLLERTKNA